jgi:hypothetical protein
VSVNCSRAGPVAAPRPPLNVAIPHYDTLSHCPMSPALEGEGRPVTDPQRPLCPGGVGATRSALVAPAAPAPGRWSLLKSLKLNGNAPVTGPLLAAGWYREALGKRDLEVGSLY